MEELRWVLLGVGIAIVVTVYFWGRTRKREISYTPDTENNDVPSFSAEDESDGWRDGVGPVRVVQRFDDDDIDAFNINEPISADATNAEIETNTVTTNTADDEKTAQQESMQQKPAIGTDDVVALYLVAQKDTDLKGEQVLSATFATHLEYGEMNVFHRKDAKGKTIFSLVNMMEPGTFDFDRMHEMTTRGISLFTQLSLCDDPVQALDDMLICAHSLASMLSIQLCDQHRQLLNEAFTKALREKAKGYAADKASAN